MKNIMHKFLIRKMALLIFLVFSQSFEASAQSIYGYVTNSTNDTLLQGALITVLSSKDTYFYETSLDGYYSFDLYPGTYTISCTRSGYETQTIENIILEYDMSKLIDFKLFKIGAVPNIQDVSISSGIQQNKEMVIPGKRGFFGAFNQGFNKNQIVGLGIGYQIGEIGGITGILDLSLSRLIGGSIKESGFYTSFSFGNEKKYYKSKMFNDSNLDYQFSFTRASVGLKKVFVYGQILFYPEVSFGAERAKPITVDVNELIDNGYIYALYLKPSFSIGYAISSKIVTDITLDYYSILQKTINKDKKILAAKDSETNSWNPYGYSDDFFENRKGLSLMLGLKFYFN